MCSPPESTPLFRACWKRPLLAVERVHWAARRNWCSRSTRLPIIRAAQRPHQDTHLWPHRKDFGNIHGQLLQKWPHLQFSTHELKRVAKYHVLPPLGLEIFFHVLTDNLDFAVRSLFKLVDDKVCILATKVVQEHLDFEAYQTLQVTLTLSSDDKPACNVVVVTDFGTLRLTFNKLVTADVAKCGIIILLLLAGAKALHRPIRPENRHDLYFPHDERVKERPARLLWLSSRCVGQSYTNLR